MRLNFIVIILITCIQILKSQNCKKEYDILDIRYDTTYIYKGNNYNVQGIKKITIPSKIKKIEKVAPSTKWVKKEGNQNCLSRDPNDCLVWCLVEIPGIYEEITLEEKTYYIVTDTSLVKDYILEIKIMNFRSGRTVKKEYEYVCKEKISKNLIAEVEKYLITIYELDFSDKSKLVKETKYALEEFQLEHQLPVGELNYPTLEYMKIDEKLYK